MNGQSESKGTSQSDYRGSIADRIEARIERRQARRTGAGTVIGGVFLVCLGAGLLLEYYGQLNLDRWAGLFILFPAAAAFWKAFRDYRTAGYLNGPAIFALVGGVVLCLVTATVVFDLNSALLGPIALILLGIGVLARKL